MYKKHRIHFVGIGGVGMSGIAEVLLNLGYPVSGSDLKRSNVTRRLKDKGAFICYGHRRPNIGWAEVVVVSSAIRKDNPELLEAKKRKIKIIQRAEMLAELMRFSKYGVAVSGTHGKTTTTSLVASILYAGGLDPTMIIGGRVNSFRSNARLGRGDFMVAEADESDGSFLKLSPAIEVITNIDREHMDYYKNFEEVKNTYLEFTKKIPFYGAAICCIDHPVVRSLIPKIEKRVVTYGLSDGAQFIAKQIKAKEGKMTYQLSVRGESRGKITLNLMGRHNVQNSLAALAVADELEIPLTKAAQALRSFKGIHRRCEILFRNKNITVIDDYGHHPEEIKATLKAISESYPKQRLVCLFQPHRYTRTQDLFGELAGAFDKCDFLMMTDIYSAGETPIKGIHSQKLVSAIKRKRRTLTVYLHRSEKLIDDVLSLLRPKDILVMLGAGDVTQIGRECARRLKRM